MKNKKGTSISVRSILPYVRDEIKVPDAVIRKIAWFYLSIFFFERMIAIIMQMTTDMPMTTQNPHG